MMFEFILDDRNLAAPMKALIGRLQIPMVKVAIADVNTALGHLEYVLTGKKHAAGNDHQYQIKSHWCNPVSFFIVSHGYVSVHD
jgi:hypothetical protein